MNSRRIQPEDYTVGWIAALPVELAAAAELLDEEHPELLLDPNETNIYTLGRMSGHNVVIACLPAGHVGTNSAATLAVQMKSKFPAIRFGLMVGVGGGVPGSADIRLGDVVVSQPSSGHGGVIQYDFGTTTASGFQRKGFLNAPPPILLNALSNLRASYLRDRGKVSEHLSVFHDLPLFQRANAGDDVLFEPAYNHVHGLTCGACNKHHLVVRGPREKQDIEIHYGTIASGNQVIRDGVTRDHLSAELGGVLCFEMEAAGLMNSFPSLVIRGICDYADTHKNKRWQPFAAAAAAAYAKDLLSIIPAADVMEASSMSSKIGSVQQEQRALSSNWTIDVHRPLSRSPGFNTNDTMKLSQLAYRLYSTLQGSEERHYTGIGLSDLLFGLHCSLNHLADYMREGLPFTDNITSQTSNVFRRPDILIFRCREVLDEVHRAFDEHQYPEEFIGGSALHPGTADNISSQNAPAQCPIARISNERKVVELQSEIQWCLSCIDILLSALLRPSQSTPRSIRADCSQGPFFEVHNASNSQWELQRRKHAVKSLGLYTQEAPESSRKSMAFLPITLPKDPRFFTPRRERPKVSGPSIGISSPENPDLDYPNHLKSTANVGRHPAMQFDHPPLPLPNQSSSDNIINILPNGMELPTFSHLTLPSIWINTIRTQLAAWESISAESPQERRARQKYAVYAMISLNSHLGSIKDIHSKCDLREQLEHHGLIQVMEKMKEVLGRIVMLEKQVETYLDDRAEDNHVS